MISVSGSVGALLIYVCFAAYFADELITKYLPENMASFILENKLYILVVAVFLNVISVVQHIKKKKKEQQIQDIEPVSARRNASSFSDSDDGMFRVDQQQLAQHRQTDKQMMDIAASTSWEPLLAGGGTNVKLVKLKQLNPSRLEVVRASQFYSMLGLTILLGMVMPIGMMLLSSGLDDLGLNAETIMPLLFALIFAGVGFAMMYYPRPRVFDKTLGWFWLGKKRLKQTADIKALNKSCSLADIAALQLLSEHISGENSSFKSYELNLILKDGSRLNVMDHGDKSSVVDDAKMLADFLGVPILR